MAPWPQPPEAVGVRMLPQPQSGVGKGCVHTEMSSIEGGGGLAWGLCRAGPADQVKGEPGCEQFQTEVLGLGTPNTGLLLRMHVSF